MRAPRSEPERGSGTIVAVTAIAVLAFVAVALVALTTARMARHQAGTAADLSALAAADALINTGEQPCAVAAQTAAANGAELTECAIVGETVTVRVAIDVRLGSRSLGTAEARARAGPVDLAG